jgi:ABC-2 type transport system ATP-binding protein
MNLIFPTGGSARIMGMDVIKDSKKIKDHVGYIPSDASAYSFMSVHEFLGYCNGFYKHRNGENRIKELSEIFELDLNRKIAELSMGNRKKVSIVQSLLHNPKLLILDEATTGLDPLMQSKFFDVLRSENKKGATIFYSSHVLSEVQMLCKRVAIIKDGRIIQQENIETLRKKQLKKIYLEMADPANKEVFTLPGIENLIPGPGNTVSFMFSGDLNELVRSFSEQNLTNLIIEEPSLDEIFMHYYK